MSTPINLLTIEVGSGYEVLESGTFDLPTGEEICCSEEIITISGTVTVSP